MLRLPRFIKTAAPLPLAAPTQVLLVRILAAAPAALPRSGRRGAVRVSDDRTFFREVSGELFNPRKELAADGSTVVGVDKGTLFKKFFFVLAGPGVGRVSRLG